MSIVFDILPEKPVKVKRIWIHFQVSSIVLTFSFCFVNFCFSKGNQNSTASIFIGVVPVLEIKPRSVTKRVGKWVCDTRYKLSLCGLLWYSRNNSVSLNTAVCLMHESHTSCMLILNRLLLLILVIVINIIVNIICCHYEKTTYFTFDQQLKLSQNN